MKHKKSGSVWQGIIAKNENWFSKSNIRFWSSKIYWDTLTERKDGWRFVSSEKNFDGTKILFTLRVATENGIETIGQFQGYETLEDARLAI